MSRYHRPEADQSDRPTLPPIRDLFRGEYLVVIHFVSLTRIFSEELSQSPRPPYPSTNSPSFSFARLSFDDDEEASQQMSDPRRTPHSHTRRLDRPISQVRILSVDQAFLRWFPFLVEICANSSRH